jgi:hypothetical protein
MIQLVNDQPFRLFTSFHAIHFRVLKVNATRISETMTCSIFCKTIPGECKCRVFHDEGSVGRIWSRASKRKRPHPARRIATRMKLHPPKYASHQASVPGSAFSMTCKSSLGWRTRLIPIQSGQRDRAIRSTDMTNSKPFSPPECVD